jgi:ketosteroid isomerase-like protein
MTEVAPAPADPAALELAQGALLGVQRGSRTGDWSGLLDLVTDDVTFYTPTPGFDGGLNRGRERLVELTLAHARATSTETWLKRTLANGRDIAFEVRVEGRLNGGPPYANQLFLVFGVEDGRIARMRWHSAAPRGLPGLGDGRDAFDAMLVERDGLPAGASDAIRLERPAPDDLRTAQQVLAGLQSGAHSGEWGELLALVRDDFSMWVPVPGMYGFRRGRIAAEQLFAHHAGETRTELRPMRLLANGNEFAYELRAEGTIDGRTYSNQLLMLLVVEDGGWKQFREYCAAHGGWTGLDVAREAWDHLRTEATA